jgi:serine/threonine-protein kinase
VHVADFGVASAAGLDSLTKTGTVIGTAGYLSPEQAQGKPATPASDRYALGIVAFELLAGSRPFRSASSTVEALAHVRSPVPSLAERRGGLPGSLDAVLQRALAKSPADRFPTCAAFVTALHEAFAGPAVTDAGEPTRVLPPPGARRRRRVLPLALAIALAACGALAAFLVSTRGGSGPARPRVDRVTVTRRGSTVIRTVTAKPPATSSTTTTTTTTTPTTSPAATASSPSAATAAAEGFSKMQGGDYGGALPLLEQAARGLRGSGSLAEAYNDFNLALTLEKLQGCSPRVLALLNASQAIQGRRPPIDALRRTCATG